MRLHFPKWVPETPAAPAFITPTSATKSQTQFSPVSPDDNRFMWFAGAGYSPLLFQRCVQLVCHQRVNRADEVAAALHGSALMLTCEWFVIQESYMQIDWTLQWGRNRKRLFICEEFCLRCLIWLIPGPPLLLKTLQWITLLPWIAWVFVTVNMCTVIYFE